MNIRSILLTGDSESIGYAIAKKLGVDEVGTELLPNQKLDRINDLLNQKKKVAMVMVILPLIQQEIQPHNVPLNTSNTSITSIPH